MMATKNRKFNSTIKPLVACLALLGVADAAFAADQFAVSPYLRGGNVQVITQNSAPPLVAILADNSGSMNWKFKTSIRDDNGWDGSSDPRYWSRSKWLRETMKPIANQYWNKFQWLFFSFNKNAGGGMMNSAQDVNDKIADISWVPALSYATPITRRYYESLEIVKDNIQSRCQKVFYIVLTDGVANASCAVKTTGKSASDWANYGAKNNWYPMEDRWTSPPFVGTEFFGTYDITPSQKLYDINGGKGVKQGASDWWFYHGNEWAYYGGATNPNSSSGTTDNACQTWDANEDNPSHWYWDNAYKDKNGRVGGMAFFSQKVGVKDIRPDLSTKAGDCQAINGQPANPDCRNKDDNPYDTQTINTITMAFSSGGMSDYNKEYLRLGSCKSVRDENGSYRCVSEKFSNGGLYFEATDDPNKAAENLSSIFNFIAGQTVSRPGIVSAYGSTAPAVLGSDVPNTAASVYVDAGKWASQLRFSGLTPPVDSWVAPDFSNRRTLISTYIDPASRLNRKFWQDSIFWADQVGDEVLSNDYFNIGKDYQKIEAETYVGNVGEPRQVFDNATYSGGGKVGWLSRGKSINIPVTVTEAGNYTLNVYYASGESRNMTVKVNNVEKFNDLVITKPRWWSVVQGKTIPQVSLNKGENWVVITTTDRYGPDVDYITIARGDDPLEWKKAVLPWTIRDKNGDDVNNSRFSQTYRQRDAEFNDLGDILGNAITTVGAPQGAAKQPQFMLAAANDGMVHIFKYQDSDVSVNAPYSLALSYIPAAMEGVGDTTLAHKLTKVSAADYGSAKNPHQFLVSGGVVAQRFLANIGTVGDEAAASAASDATVSTSSAITPRTDERMFMVGNMGQGGRGAYALNLQPLKGDFSEDWRTKVPLFETAKSGVDSVNPLAFTVGSPAIGRVSVLARNSNSGRLTKVSEGVHTAAVISNGFSNDNYDADIWKTQKIVSALNVYDALGDNAYTGAALSKDGSAIGKLLGTITVKDGAGNPVYNGLAEPTLVDIDFDGVVDIAYAGDIAGNMYRFDLRGVPAQWKAVKIFSGKGRSQPITSAPAVSRNKDGSYIVIFGTGSEIYETDLNDRSVQAVYGIVDNPSNTTPTAVAWNSDQLLVQNITGEVSKTIENETLTFRTISHNEMAPAQVGWKLELGGQYGLPGERVTVKPTVVARSVLITTHSYGDVKTISTNGNTDVCRPLVEEQKMDIKSVLMGIDARTGGAVSSKDVSVKDWQQDNGYYLAGVIRDGMREMTYFNPNDNAADGSKLSQTRDGDSGGSGTVLGLNIQYSDEGPNPIEPPVPNNECFTSGNAGTIVSAGGDDAPRQLELAGGKCPRPTARRLSWREIF